MKRYTDAEYRLTASRLFHRDGELELDPNAVVSESDDAGAYVQCWVWVDDASVRREEANNA